MNRKRIIFTILGGVLALIVIVVLWFLFFGRHPAPTTNDTGTFGTAEDANRPTGGSTGPVGNGETQLQPNTGAGTSQQYHPTYPPPSGTPVPGGAFGSGPATSVPPSDVTWIVPSNVTLINSGKVFTPTPINKVNNVNITGTAYFKSSNGSTGGGGATDPITGQLIACTATFLTGAANGAIASAVGSVFAVTVNAPVQNMKDADTLMKEFLGCIARTLARAILSKITSNVVDWVNSGFNGQPAFVQDFKQFFTDAAESAASSFIQGSDFSFLCSPVQGPVKVAIAQSYARNRSGGSGGAPPNSCSMSSGQGRGWGGILSLTTSPTNNAFGAYMYEQQQLDQAQANAVTLANRQISPGGYLPATDSGGGALSGKIITPSGTVEALTNKQLGIPQDLLVSAKNFDEIITALLTQLVDRAIYQGLAKLSGQGGYASNFSSGQDQQATAAAQKLLVDLQSALQAASQYGGVEQGSISDVQNAQAQLQNLANCWSTIASSTGSTQAGNNANATNAQFASLEVKVAQYNTNIIRANNSMVQIQQFQTDALAATTVKDIAAVEARLNAAGALGSTITTTDVLQAQQDRTTLQAQMSTLNTQTIAGLNQCHAYTP